MKFNASGAKDAKGANGFFGFTLAPFAPLASFALVFCQNQDSQDLMIFRMSVAAFILSIL